MLYILLAVINATINTLVKQREKLVNDFLAIVHPSRNLPTRSSQGISPCPVIQPIEHITPRSGETEKDVTIRSLHREHFWMLELVAVYPYGLNDRLKHVGNVSHPNLRSGINVLNLFNRHKRRKRSHGHRRNSRHTADITQ